MKKQQLLPIISLLLLNFLFTSGANNELLAQKRSTPAKKSSTKDIELNFSDIEIRNLVNIISEMTGKTFLFDEKKFRGKKITLVSQEKFSKSEAVKIFSLVLEANGLATIEKEGLLHIVTNKEAKTSPTPFVPDGKTKVEDEYITRIIRIKNGSVNAMRSSLAPLISRNATLSIYAPANLLLINDQKKATDRLVTIIQALDKLGPVALVNFIPIKNSDPNAIVQLLNRIFKQTAPKTKNTMTIVPQFIADKNTNQIIVLSSREDLARAKGYTKQLDKADSSTFRPTILSLQFTSAQTTVNLLKQIFKPNPRTRQAQGGQTSLILAPNNGLNQILIIADQQTTTRVQELVLRLDQPTPNNRVIRQVPLKYANPQEMVNLLKRVYSPSQLGKKGAPQPFISKISNASKNVLVISDEATVNEIETLLTDLDTSSKFEKGQSKISILPLHYTNAQEVVNVLRQAFPANRSRGAQAGAQQPSMNIARIGQDRLLLVADDTFTAKIKALIQELDQPLEDHVTELISLQHIDAKSLSQILIKVFPQERKRVGTKNIIKPILNPIEFSNQLLVVTDPKMLEKMKDLIASIDIDQAKQQELKITILPLEFVDGQDVVGILQQIFQPQQSQTARRTSANTSSKERGVLNISSISANRLLIIANQKSTERIKGLLRELDQPTEDGAMTLISLKYSDAKTTSTILTKVFTGTGGKGGKSSTTPQPIILALENSNQLLVVASGPTTQKIKKMVVDLDQALHEKVVEFIPIEHAVAKDIASLLTEIYKKTDGEKAPAKVNFFSDLRTNTLIILTPQDEVSKIRSRVAQLDENILSSQGKFRVFGLKNAKADAIAAVLQKVTKSIVPSSTKGGKAAGGKTPTSTGKAGNSEISIIPDTATNSLVIFADPSEFPTLEKVIEELDVSRPQVFVEALIMEMTLDKTLQLGVQWEGGGFVRNGDSTGLISAGSPTGGLKTFESASNGAPADAVMGFLGNPVSFAGQDFNSFSAFIRAAQTDKEINILSTPKILTLNNEEAEIKVGRIVPTLKSATLDSNQNPVRTYDYKEVGVTLQITPQINADDSIQLKINQVSNSVIPDAGQDGAITTLNRSLKTNVLIHNNETIVLGGLIHDEITDSESKTPCLGDIPILGWAFKSKSQTINKTNLLIFLTPRVVRGKEDIAPLTSSTTDQLRNALEGKFRVKVSHEFNMPSLLLDDSVKEEPESDATSDTPKKTTPTAPNSEK